MGGVQCFVNGCKNEATEGPGRFLQETTHGGTVLGQKLWICEPCFLVLTGRTQQSGNLLCVARKLLIGKHT